MILNVISAVLQVGSVTAPRKIIDMDVVSHEGLDSTIQSLQRDSRKAKQLLLEIERVCSKLYQRTEQADLCDLFSAWLLT